MQAYFDESSFKQRVDTAMQRVRQILEHTRKPQYPADVPHVYDDKYILVEHLSRQMIMSLMHCLERLGLTPEQLNQLKTWGKTHSVTLSLRATETCKFQHKAEREVESATKEVTKTTLFGKFESSTVTKITEWFWEYESSWTLLAYKGAEPDDGLVLQRRNGKCQLKTTVETAPKPATVIVPAQELNITWLLQHIDAGADNKPQFSIDRKAEKCRTPRRNPEVEDALSFLRSVYRFFNKVATTFTGRIFPVETTSGTLPTQGGPDLSALEARSVFVPIIPLMEEHGDKKEEKKGFSGAVPVDLSMAFFVEEVRGLAEKYDALTLSFPAATTGKVITVTEARVVIVSFHAAALCNAYNEGVYSVENLLYKQLVAAIGKEVTADDFSKYLLFHNRKLFKPQYAPKPFCFAVRRPEHYPEGTLSVETGENEPISTVCHSDTAPAGSVMYFQLDAATRVAFGGGRHLHAWVDHRFGGVANTSMSLVARARQFSSYILLVGRIASANVFDPKYAVIVKDKDELRILLSLETLPTPKEFRDAIASLSPEQQRFAKQFREMQLASTLFGVAVLQIKPQLEKLLRLPYDSLTKEIELTQDLLDLFITYQIPSDLLSYDGDEKASVEDKVARVKGFVVSMKALIGKQKDAELAEAKQQQDFRRAQELHDSLPAVDTFYSAVQTSAPMPQRSMMLARSGAAQPRMSAMAFSSPPPPPSAMAPPSAPMPSSIPTPAPAPAPAPAQPPQQQQQQQQQQQEAKTEPVQYDTHAGTGSAPGGSVDYTQLPGRLEKQFSAYDTDNALRPTIINPTTQWTRRAHKSLLAKAETSTVSVDQQKQEKQKAFDLLDALTKSGALTVDYADLHVLIAATHCFDKSIMDTVIQDNVNPIEKLERSSLLAASTIQGVAVKELIAEDQLPRIKQLSAPVLEAH